MTVTFPAPPCGQTGADLVCRWGPEQLFLSKDAIKRPKRDQQSSPMIVKSFVQFQRCDSGPLRTYPLGAKKAIRRPSVAKSFQHGASPWVNILDIVPSTIILKVPELTFLCILEKIFASYKCHNPGQFI